MEQAENSPISKNAHIVLGVSYSMLAGFMICSIFLTLGNPFRIFAYVAIAFSTVLLIFSFRSMSLNLISLAWIIIGALFVFSFVLSGDASYLTITISVLVLLLSYELTRFGFEIEPIVQRSQVLQGESLERLKTVMRNHSFVLFEVVACTFISSFVVGYFAPGVIITNPAAIGVSIFASIAVLLIVSVLFLNKE